MSQAPRELHGVFGILEEDGRLLLVTERRTLAGESHLCHDVPGGTVEQGESLLDALHREFAEETGLAIDILDLAFVIERFGVHGTDPARRSRFFFFTVRRRGGDLAPTEPDILDVQFRPWDVARQICNREYQREFWAWVDGGRTTRYFLDDRRGAPRTLPPQA